MSIKPILLKSFLALVCLLGLSLLAQDHPGLYELKPGFTRRGQQPETWTLDLRDLSPGAAAAAAAKLSSRLYGSGDGPLHQPLLIRTRTTVPKVFAFELAAVSVGGGELILQTNGVTLRRYTWPAAGATHQVNRLVWFPLPPGETTLQLQAARGVMVIPCYFLADSPTQLPAQSRLLAFNAPEITPMAKAESEPDAKSAEEPTGGVLAKSEGFRGIWYYNQPTRDEYAFKYSGGLATYPQQHVPIAIYCAAVDKTFFVYGGTTARTPTDKQELLHMVSYFDHKTGLLARPRILLNKHTTDAHDNPTLQVDDRGYLWIFSTSHGAGRPSYIHRSVKPWSIDEFQRVLVSNFSYTEPWYLPGTGFLFLHTRYGGGRARGIDAERVLFWMTSRDGLAWQEPQMLAGIERGDYQVSWRSGQRVGTAFDFHPSPVGLNARANLYYLETEGLGGSWRNVRGEPVTLPLTTTNNPALVFDSRAAGLLVYLKDLNFNREGHPVILFLTSKGFEPGPENGPRQWQTIRWTGQEWVRRPFTTSGNNYDHGSLYLEDDGTWRVIGATELGPQPYNPGGEIVLWTSADQGATWVRVKQLTRNSPRNHTYPRRPLNAHPDFYALWADGNARQPSESHLYFTNRRGDHVWRLPPKVTGDFAKPEVAW